MQHALDYNYWDIIADRLTSPIFEKNVGLYYKNEHIDLIKRWSEGVSGKRILKTDLFEEAFSCGDFLSWLSKQNAIVSGIDISYKIVRKAYDNIGDYHSTYGKSFIVSDVSNCAFKNDSFDLVISNSTIDNLSSEDAILALREFRRILRPAGILILTLDNRNNPLYFLGYLVEKVLKTNKYYQGRCYSVKEAMHLAEENSFKVEEIT
ncbi:class I SAM-dependent methyltransferase, partial [bacterium]